MSAMGADSAAAAWQVSGGNMLETGHLVPFAPECRAGPESSYAASESHLRRIVTRILRCWRVDRRAHAILNLGGARHVARQGYASRHPPRFRNARRRHGLPAFRRPPEAARREGAPRR